MDGKTHTRKPFIPDSLVEPCPACAEKDAEIERLTACLAVGDAMEEFISELDPCWWEAHALSNKWRAARKVMDCPPKYGEVDAVDMGLEEK